MGRLILPDIAPTFSFEDEKDFAVISPLFQSSKARKAATRGWQEEGVHLFGGIMSDSPKQLAFVDLLTRTLQDKIDVNVDDYGRVFGTGVRSSWYGARHVAGYPAKRGTWPLYDNSKKRADQKLADGFVEPWHRNLYAAWIRLAFSGLVPEAMRIRKGASSCIPTFVTDTAGRLEIAVQAYKDALPAGTLCLKGKHREAFILYSIGGAYYVVYRRQSSDKIEFTDGEWVPKDRFVADLEYALTGGRKGKQVLASKLFDGPDDPSVPAGFFRQRLRTATGIPGPLGATLTPIAQSVRTRLYHQWNFTYHHTTRLQKENKLKKFAFTIPADVSDHDINWPLWIIEDVAVPTLLEMGFEPWWVELFRMSFRLPVYASCPAPGEGQLLIGDWRHPDGNLGLCSGNPFTDLLGSWNMTVVYAMIQIEHTARHHIRALQTEDSAVRWLDSYMRGQLEIAVMDKSDDALLLWSDSSNLHLAQALLDKMQSGEQVNPYMQVSYEHGGAFLGDVLLYGPSRSLHDVTLIGNINSFIVNQFSPEYGAPVDRSDSFAGFKARQSSKRPYPGIAWQSVTQVYGSAPCFCEVLEIIEFAWSRTHGGSYRAFRERLLREDLDLLHKDMLRQNLVGVDVSAFSPIDTEVLSSGDRIDWKYSPEDLSNPAILGLLSSAVPLETVSPYFKSINRSH